MSSQKLWIAIACISTTSDCLAALTRNSTSSSRMTVAQFILLGVRHDNDSHVPFVGSLHRPQQVARGL